MPNLAYSLFDTPIGCCAIVWSGRGIAGVQLPEANRQATEARVRKRFPDARESAPRADVQIAIAGMVALLAGEARDFRGVALDTEGIPDFNRKVYAMARGIPPGETRTYGEIAERLGGRHLARAVGQALGENPIPLIVPCHRVLAAGGKSGGFSAGGGVVTKLRLLTIEGAQPGGPTLFGPLPLSAPPRRHP
ncbi:MAG: methylated-DNA--[protein]-cysteine S-methyltransferase [Pseudorhodoplanes sp.]